MRELWRQKAPDLLVEIADTAASVLRDVAGMEAGQADYLGYHIMHAIAAAAGGAQVYIPKADSIARCMRDEAIWQDFDGQNTRDLARRYGVTEAHIYRIIKRMRAIEAQRRQAVLDL